MPDTHERTLRIDPDITKAETPPGWLYTDPEITQRLTDRVLARSWRPVAHDSDLRVPGSTLPLTFLEGCLNEPLVLTRDWQDQIHCLSNVCTHRAMTLVEHAGCEKKLTCRYHGRQFDMDGVFRSMPEFKACQHFPRPDDNLRQIPCAAWQGLRFASLDPEHTLEQLTQEMDARVNFLPFSQARFDPTRARDYLVRANWALYVENYLEGFHIPFVHASLAQALDYAAYEHELYPLASLQLGVASGGDDTFDIPHGHPDHGRNIAAYYYWLFPTTMINVYPWGVSLNDVQPLGMGRCKVRFLPYVWDESRLDQGAGADLDRVEREDESVVEQIQRSIGSRHYTTGRYSPTREQCVHHFHRLLAERLNAEQ